MRLPLSVLDLTPVPAGSSPGDALRNTIDLARHAEALGCARYWLAEHHNAASLACPAPEVMIGQVAAATRAIRVGAGGIMLPNHTPLKVAETFRVLHALFPGRIDLGLGRAPGTDPRTAAALRRSREALAVDDFPERLAELESFLADDGPPRPAFTGSIRAIPHPVAPPETWMLGSTEHGATLAAARGMGFAFAHHINADDAIPAMLGYRERFVPSGARRAPWAILAVAAVCADDDEEAERLASSGRLAMVRFAQGTRDWPIPTVEEALAHRYDAEERAIAGAYGARAFVGGATKVKEAILRLAEATRADEVMVLTHVHAHAARKRSYELLAQ